MTLGPVSAQASLVTLKMPAPMRMPSSAAYDSTVPRSRRRLWAMWQTVTCGTGSQPVRGRGAAALRRADGLRTRPTFHRIDETQMKRRTKILIGIAVLLVAAIAFAVVRSRRGKDVTAVTMAKVGRKDLVSKVSANGKIDAKRKVDLSANVMGQIVNLAVREGDVVKKGTFLLQIDQKQLAASAQGAAASLQALFSDRDAARASAVQAQRDFERAQKNFAQKIIPAAEIDRARAGYDGAQ